MVKFMVGLDISRLNQADYDICELQKKYAPSFN